MAQQSKGKRSVGTLRRTPKKTKERSPQLIGTLRLQRHTHEAIAKEFEMTDQDEVICNIAAWSYDNENGGYLNVEISPPYRRKQTPRPDILESIFNDN